MIRTTWSWEQAEEVQNKAVAAGLNALIVPKEIRKDGAKKEWAYEVWMSEK